MTRFPPVGSSRRGPRMAVAAALTCLLTGALTALPSGARPSATTAGTPAVTVSFDAGAPGPAVAARFLGLSFEAANLPDLARFATAGDLPLLLRSLGPNVLRIGGATADSRVAFVDGHAPTPAWATTTITDADLQGLARLARAAGSRVLLTVDLGHDDPQAAAREVAAAQHALGSSLLGVEIGNEPDAFGTHRIRPLPWSFTQYAPEINAYRAAIARLAPGVALAGPDTTGARFAAWGPGEARVEHPALLTTHRYPLVCSDVPAPSIDSLLSTATRQRDLVQLASDVAIARRGAIPLRIDETNSVSCGGRAGVSDTFASALWAVQLMTEAMQLGIVGVNFHDLPANCSGYSPLCATSSATLMAGRLVPAPEWYALLLVRTLVGERPLPTTVGDGSPSILASAFAGGATTHVVLTDTEPSGPPHAVQIRVGSLAHTATVVTLTAPSLASTTGVRLGGAAVTPAGSLLGPLDRTTVKATHGVVTVTLAPASAALVTVVAGH